MWLEMVYVHICCQRCRTPNKRWIQKKKTASRVGHLQKPALLDILGARFLLPTRSNKLPPITTSFHLLYTRKLALARLLGDQSSFSLPLPWTEPDSGKLWAQGAFYQVEQEVSQGGHCITLISSEKKTLSLLCSVVIPQTQKAFYQLPD